VPNWLEPIERGRPAAAPTPTRIRTIQRDGRINFERAVERFSENHTSPKNGRPYSRTSRANIRGNLLGGPLRMFREQHEVTYIDEWTDTVAAEYLRWLQYDMGRDSATIKKVRSQLRQLALYAAEHLGAPAAVGGQLERLRVSSAPDEQRPEQPVLTQGETDTLLRRAATDRDRLIIALLLYTGMRPSELLALDEERVRLDREPPVVEIRGSVHDAEVTKSQAGYRDIPLTIGQKLVPKLLRAHLSDPERPRGASRLFLSTRSDRSGRFDPLTMDGLRTMLAVLGIETGIKCNPYRFRHTFCTWCADAGMHMLHLQQLLGHASSHMVAYYYRGKTSDAVLQAAARVRF